ncbi:MAG: hypothetical protein OXS50_09225 [Gammaproteobacteria bacterium]|nr:hypothetical protein [Gammaproteobacteria bacterium]
MRHEHGTDGEERRVEYEIVEAYYDDGHLVCHSDPHGAGDSLEELRRVLATMQETFEKPVLVLGDFRGPREVTQAGGAEPGASPAHPGDEG